ncbi:MAG: IS200/IS605 family transposase [Gemmataceae bacterium]|nr:IS200/IS605 family transposase [Gemmataceae bacterium]
MSQSLAQIYVHIVFSTKHRTPWLSDAIFRGRVHAYLATACQTLGSPALEVGGVADHVHLLMRLGKTSSISDLLRDLKRDSTNWIHVEGAGLSDFHWQNGYGAFSLSPSHVEAVREYIRNQEEHHRKISFQDEFRRLCAKYGAPLDERYAWD